MLDFREELRIKEEVDKILKRLPLYHGVDSIDDILNNKNLVFIISDRMLYIREYSNEKVEEKGVDNIFKTSEHAKVALGYIENTLKTKYHNMVKNRGRLYITKKS